MNPICPYCHTEIEPADAGKYYCPNCGAAHHGECWEENGGCTVFGCARAPGEGPTVIVAASDLASPPPPPPPPPAPPPPPGRVAGSAPPPSPPPASRPDLGQHMSFGGYNPPALHRPAASGVRVFVAPAKNRITFILLGVFLGFFGAHNFYAGYTGRALAQLCITVCTLFTGAIVSWIWAVVEVCIVDKDFRNIRMD